MLKILARYTTWTRVDKSKGVILVGYRANQSRVAETFSEKKEIRLLHDGHNREENKEILLEKITKYVEEN